MARNRVRIPLEERRADLIGAATEVFLARGYEGATMEEISTAAGVTRANIYWYFKSKDEVFAAVMRQLLTRDFRALAEENAALDPISRLTRGLVSMRSYRSLHQAMHDRLMHHEGVRESHDLWLEWLRDRVQDIEGIDDQRELAAHLIEAVFEAVHLPLEHRRPPHEMIRYVVELISESAGRRSS